MRRVDARKKIDASGTLPSAVHTPEAAHHRLERLGLFAGLFLAGLTLRPQIVGLGPLIPEMKMDLAVSHAVAGLLSAIPLICMGAFAFPAPALSRRYGARAVIAAGLGIIAVFGVARAMVPDAALVIALTIGVGVGIGVAQSVMPVAVKERFAHRPAFATGIYVAGINIGSAVSSAVAVPLAHALGSWRSPLAIFSLSTGVLMLAWLWLTKAGPSHRRAEVRIVALPWRHPTSWLLAVIFGVMSCIFYGLNSWLPDSYVDHGWSHAKAGTLLAILNMTALATTLLVPWLADRRGSRRLFLTGLGTLMLTGCVGFVLLPYAGWAWAALVGLAVGGMFPLVMTLPVDVGHRPAEVAAIAGIMLGGGYAIAAVSPLLLGAVRDATGSYRAVLCMIAAAAALLLALCSALSRERLHRGTLGAPAQH
ncbi:MAG: CynX/NimT family MFS transporter [Candidatus Binatia bacterium]